MKDVAFWTNASCQDPETGTFAVNATRKNEPGYARINDGWKTLEAAQQYADEVNADNGLTKDEVREIIMSSHAAQADRERKREYLDLTPDPDNFIRLARKILWEAEPGSNDINTARAILAECKVKCPLCETADHLIVTGNRKLACTECDWNEDK